MEKDEARCRRSAWQRGTTSNRKRAEATGSDERPNLEVRSGSTLLVPSPSNGRSSVSSPDVTSTDEGIDLQTGNDFDAMTSAKWRLKGGRAVMASTVARQQLRPEDQESRRRHKMRQIYKSSGHSISDTSEQRPKVSWDSVTVYGDHSTIHQQKLEPSTRQRSRSNNNNNQTNSSSCLELSVPSSDHMIASGGESPNRRVEAKLPTLIESGEYAQRRRDDNDNPSMLMPPDPKIMTSSARRRSSEQLRHPPTGSAIASACTSIVEGIIQNQFFFQFFLVFLSL